jgi:hypothetical protein
MKMNTLNGIEIAVDLTTPESDQFAIWLQERGAIAYVSNTTKTTINGGENNELSEMLWNAYCNCTEPTSERVAELLAEMK